MVPDRISRPKTFISYARADSQFALRLASDLRASGINIWLDRFDIPVGMNWPHAVQEALDACDQFLVILSPASIGSADVMAESITRFPKGSKSSRCCTKTARCRFVFAPPNMLISRGST